VSNIPSPDLLALLFAEPRVNVFITVIICTRNRADSLRQTLEALFCSSNLTALNWEVLVVENADQASGVCFEFQQRFPNHFRFLTEPKVGKSNALNTAIRAAKGNVLAFTDDDVLCEPHYIQAIQTVFGSNLADAAQGRVLLDCEGGWPEWLGRGNLAMMANFRDYGDEIINLEGTLCGANMVVRTEVFEKVGGFAPELGPGGLGMWEDTEISLRIREAGFRIIYAPQIVMRHPWSRGRLTKAFIRSRYFGEGRAQGYYTPLPVPLWRFGLYVIKETIVQECAAIWNLYAGRPEKALACQCAARSQAGLFWQHWRFKRGVRRELSECLLSSTCK
jgi:glucosyl-dolichyl phosphate glucuronosyltransferase